MDCIFCAIISGDIPAFKLHEDDHSLAFMDINPLSEGHALVIPKKHFENLFVADEEALGHVMAAAKKVANAICAALNLTSMNLVQANGEFALQSVPHFHVHLIPRREQDRLPLDWGLSPGNIESIKSLSEVIREKLG